MYFILCRGGYLIAQETQLQGRVVDIWSGEPIALIQLSIDGTLLETLTDADGLFSFKGQKLPLGEQLVLVRGLNYRAQSIPVVLMANTTIDLNPILLEVDVTALQGAIGVISLSETDLNQEDGVSSSISGLLQATNDVFLRAAAYDFSATFFKPRGLDNAHGKVLINGVEMNKLWDGRPQWANWGGLNDVQRNRDFTMGLRANDYVFGDVAGTTNINMRASQFRKGGQVSIANANRSYQARVMGTYNSGVSLSGWAYSISAARRYGTRGFVEGTGYDANSFFIAVEKKLDASNSLNISAIYTPNKRGRSSPMTEEVYQLKGIRYNPNWGLQDNKIRNSRVRTVDEPIIILSHYLQISEKTEVNTNLSYQTGTIKNSRIDANGTRLVETTDGQTFFVGGARNPLGDYYQRLPSFFLKDPSPTAYQYQLAYQATQSFLSDGQLDWNQLYSANRAVDGLGRAATYILQNDVMEDLQITGNILFSTELNEHFSINGSLSHRNLTNTNYAEVEDLLGSTGYLDIDSFTQAASGDASEGTTVDRAQSDLQHLNNIALEGERYKYHYQIKASESKAFVQGQFSFPKTDFYLGVVAEQTSYQREGFFENGNFPGNQSLGKGPKLNFTSFGGKGGFLYKVTGRHLVDINAGYFTKPPSLRNSFSNARQNNEVVLGLSNTTISSANLNYRFRSSVLKARLTGYYLGFENQSDIGFYFTQSLSGMGKQGNAFVQEVVSAINTRTLGAELGLEVQLTSSFLLKAVGAFRNSLYTNNPTLYLTSDDFQGPISFGDGTTFLKNFHLSNGPERAYQFGFEYRDPNYWWLGLTGNYFSDAYIDVNNLRRSANYTTDFDGQPFNDFDPVLGRDFLRQEKIDPYFLLHMVGGKSWRVKQYYFGFFASVNNLLNETYKTGGFEQGRYSNYRLLKEDRSRENGPLFGNKYFFGSGTTYYVNVFLRF